MERPKQPKASKAKPRKRVGKIIHMETSDIRFIEFTLIVIMVSIIVIGFMHIGLQGKILKELKNSNYAHSSAVNYIYPLHDMILNSFIALRSDVRA